MKTCEDAKISYAQVPVVSNDEIAPQNFILEVEAPGIARNLSAGQFVMLKPNYRNSTLLGRPYSIYKREGDKIYFLYKTYGRGSTELSQMRSPDVLSIWGPLGRGFQSTLAKEWIFIAGGIGIAPFVLLAQEAPKGIKKTVYFGIKTKDQAVLEHEFRNLGCEVYFFTEDGTLGKKGFATAYLESDLKVSSSINDIEIFTCGPRAMENEVARIALSYQIPCQVAYEEYMGCGLGTCMGCVVKVRAGEDWKYARVCCEGPVFRADEIVWE